MAEFINTMDVIGDVALTSSIIDRSITEYKDNTITSIGNYAFALCTQLASVDCPNVTKIGNTALSSCSSLTSVSLPAATTIDGGGFSFCGQLKIADLPSAASIGNSAFANCGNLKAIILRNTSVCILGSGVFVNDSSVYIYVPAALVDTYKAATNWSDHASKIRALEDYTVDGTVTGELDPTKI